MKFQKEMMWHSITTLWWCYNYAISKKIEWHLCNDTYNSQFVSARCLQMWKTAVIMFWKKNYHCQSEIISSVLDWSKLCVCVGVCANFKKASTSGFDRTRVWKPLDQTSSLTAKCSAIFGNRNAVILIHLQRPAHYWCPTNDAE